MAKTLEEHIQQFRLDFPEKYLEPTKGCEMNIINLIRHVYASALEYGAEKMPASHGLNTEFDTRHPETARIQGRLEGYNRALEEVRSILLSEAQKVKEGDV